MYLKREDGVAAIEFALVLPILIVLVFGIIEFGFALYSQEVITNASREGARFGITIGNPRPSKPQIEQVVRSYLQNFALDPSKATVNVLPNPCGAFPDPLRVEVDYRWDKYPYAFGVLPRLITGFTNVSTLRARTEMRCE